MTVDCPCCRRPLPEDDIVARRGVLINEVASLGAKIVELSARLKRPFATPAEVDACWKALNDTKGEREMKAWALKEIGNR